MDCPECKKDGAYTGLLWVHCQNEKCHYFDPIYTAKVLMERAESFSEAVDKLILLQGDIGD